MVYMYSIRIRDFLRGLYGESEHVDPLKLSVHFVHFVHSKHSKHVKQVEHFESVRLSPEHVLKKLSLRDSNA